MSKEIYNVTLIDGDGIGPEITSAVVEIIEAAEVKINWDKQLAGARAYEKYGDTIPNETIESIERNKVCLKAPITTPIGTGFKSVNVALRRHFDLYANVRPSKNLPAIKTPFNDVDLVIIRENTEDIYAGIEHKIDEETIHGVKLITKKGCERICDFAFNYAIKNNRKRVGVVTKANISKLADGLFLNTFREVAKNYTDIETHEILVDNLCMQLVQKPSQFDVLVMPNLYGDIVSDLCAGLIGGLGVAQSANIGKSCAIFEAVHGSAPDIAGKNIANPTGLLRSACMMLNYLGKVEASKNIENALFEVLKEGKVLTKDLGGNSTTEEFKKEIIKKLTK
ncbi:MAG: isocitrate/isopropylmalate dehydrogenase family protein [Candidatus Gastranaerophilales bacterium]|nr:isocitrate/isopropylmalate dehydrogenase family protein [Candidatus Gastranaerophilales bacterium]